MSVSIKIEGYREKVLGCWLGKSIGGTLGMPCEGKDGPLNYSFYDPVPTQMIPNDDLDLQVLWACVMDKMEKPRVDKDILAKAWVDHVGFPWDEYGVAIRNIKRGVMPPFSGAVDNFFTRGMGAAIRSELWACLAPGNPALAAKYAYEDACVDHAGEGIWAEVLLAAMEAAAFTSSGAREIVDAGVCFLPPGSEISQAVNDAIAWWDSSKDLFGVRAKILDKYGSDNFTDVVQNVAFTVLALLSGDGDFSKTICDAVNCGKDTDCTGATAGSIIGILDPKSIDPKWLAPIGRSIVLSKEITGVTPPKSIDDFTDMVISLKDRIGDYAVQPANEVQPVRAQIAFAAKGAFDSEAAPAGAFSPISFPGACASLPADAFKADAAVLKYTVNEALGGRRRVMFNYRGKCKVWIDGKLSFSNESAPLVPSFHRCPKNQSADLELSKGRHEVIALILKPSEGKRAEWIFGVGELPSAQWTEAFKA